jgi:hypothetical protein
MKRIGTSIRQTPRNLEQMASRVVALRFEGSDGNTSVRRDTRQNIYRGKTVPRSERI